MPPALWLLPLFFVPQVADTTLPPGEAHPVHVVEGKGVQIYACRQQEGKFGWVFEAPEAKLFERSTHEEIGSHGVGPSWTWKDGSSITGKVKEKSPSPDADSIPWLLLQASRRSGVAGDLSDVVWVRRSDTHGGNAPATGCDAQHAGQTVRVPYTATYSFYKK